MHKKFFKKNKPSTKQGAWQTQHEKVSIYWPAEILPLDYTDIRVLTYGYDSRVTKYFGGAANQSNIDAYGRDFLTDLEGVRRSSVSSTFLEPHLLDAFTGPHHLLDSIVYATC